MFLILFVALISQISVAAAKSPFSETVGAPVARSVHFVRLSDGKTIYESSPDSALRPASVTKLITAAAVLDKFSPAHSFSTRFYCEGTYSAGICDGALVIVGDGDPFVVSEKLWQMSADFVHMGVREIRGGIKIDNSLFDGLERDSSRSFGRKASKNAYDAPITAFAVNFNTVAIAVAPHMATKKARVGLDPYPLASVTIKNRVSLSGTKGKKLFAKRTTGKNQQMTINVSGRIGTQEGVHKLYRSISNPVRVSGEQVRAFLQAAGVKVKGKIRAGGATESKHLLYELPSYDMTKIVGGLNKFSNNFIADVLVKRLGAAYPQKGRANAAGQGTYENGLAVLNSFMNKTVKVSRGMVLKNGSGLSTSNRLSARHLTKLLRYMAGDLKIFPEFLSSLPAAGWDGTLKDRFSSIGAKTLAGAVRGKTGTLTAPVTVVSLAGYLRHPVHGLCAFAMIENGVTGKSQPTVSALRKRQDRSLSYFAKNFKR